ncbi:MAG: hypothetical protein ACR2MN_01185 [Acidimicrobiales bacterium]
MVVATLAVVVIFAQYRMRLWEANASAFLLGNSHVASHSRSLGTAIIFPQGHSWIGLSLTAGCTAALLMTPFFLVGAGLILSRRVPVRRALISLAFVIVLVFAVNQLRFVVMAAAMRVWGFQLGYDRGHILLGTLVSTVGVALGVVTFLVALTWDGTSGRRPGRPDGGESAR